MSRAGQLAQPLREALDLFADLYREMIDIETNVEEVAERRDQVSKETILVESLPKLRRDLRKIETAIACVVPDLEGGFIREVQS